MSEITVLEQLAAIKQKLLENAAQCSKCEKERPEDIREVDAVEANLKKILETRQQIASQEQSGSVDLDSLRALIKENHDVQMSTIEGFFRENAQLDAQRRAQLLNEISRPRHVD